MSAQGQFALQIAQFSERAGARANEIARQVVLGCFDRIVARSPVDTGELKLSWSVSELGSAEVPGSAAVTGTKILGKVWRISTASPYGPAIEFGLYPNPPAGGRGRTIGGFSTQAPQGMVGLTVLEFDSVIASAAAGVR
jgi:hypothetical protein